MEYKILYSEAALIGLSEILKFIDLDNPAVSSNFGNALLHHAELLVSFPRLGAPVPGQRGLRKLLHTPIAIYYRINEERRIVEILLFWHGSRRPPKFS